jgi:hypothetical protein
VAGGAFDVRNFPLRNEFIFKPRAQLRTPSRATTTR